MSDQPTTSDEPEDDVQATAPDAAAAPPAESDPVVDQEAVASSTSDAEAIAGTAEDAPVAAAAEADAPALETDAPAEAVDEASDDAQGSTAVPTTPAPATPSRSTRSQPKAARSGDTGPKPVVRAHAKYVRTSARKARLVCDLMRGKSVEEARAILATTPRAVAEDWEKLLNSAVANAEHNHELVGDELKIHAVFADEGPTLKRFRPRAMGRATPIRKRTSHLTIQLTPQED
jgi:ribosomal protein L22